MHTHKIATVKNTTDSMDTARTGYPVQIYTCTCGATRKELTESVYGGTKQVRTPWQVSA